MIIRKNKCLFANVSSEIIWPAAVNRLNSAY